jgi:hypothetical protein
MKKPNGCTGRLAGGCTTPHVPIRNWVCLKSFTLLILADQVPYDVLSSYFLSDDISRYKQYHLQEHCSGLATCEAVLAA